MMDFRVKQIFVNLGSALWWLGKLGMLLNIFKSQFTYLKIEDKKDILL